MWRLFLAQRSTEPFSILKLPAKRSEQHLHPPNLLKEGRAPKISWGECQTLSVTFTLRTSLKDVRGHSNRMSRNVLFLAFSPDISAHYAYI